MPDFSKVKVGQLWFRRKPGRGTYEVYYVGTDFVDLALVPKKRPCREVSAERFLRDYEPVSRR